MRTLALKKMPEGVDALWVLQQIEGYQLAKKKLPAWAAKLEEGLVFPPRISMEQCSSELTARYKAELLKRIRESDDTPGDIHALIDLTGGFGVDFSYMAQGFGEAMYVEQNAQLCRIAENNLPLLGLPRARIYNIRCEDFIRTVPTLEGKRYIFLDPARRDTNGRKVVTIEDCTPDVGKMQDDLLHYASFVMVKLSPMLDITAALRTLRNVTEVHVVSVKGECKELLFVQSREGSRSNVAIHCVNLGTEENEFVSAFPTSTPIFTPPSTPPFTPFSTPSITPILTSPSSPLYLFEPNASIMKAGVQDEFGNRYGLQKLHPMSNLYVGNHTISNVPARQFRIVNVSDWSKASLKALLKDISKANLTIRNFPSDVATLRRRLKIKEGGSDYLFATTLYDGTHALLHCVKC